MASIPLKSLVLNASEIRELTKWPPAIIEDYLSMVNNLIVISQFLEEEISTKLEEIRTNFSNGSVPYVDSNYLAEDNTNFRWDSTNKILHVLRIILSGVTAAPGTAPIKFENGTLLTTEEPGVLEYADNKLHFTNCLKRKVIDRTSDVSLSTVTVANTTDETVLWTGPMAADSLVAGNLFKFHANGLVSNNGPAAVDEVTVRIKVGGVVVVTLNPNLKALTNTEWHLDANVVQRTLGAAGERAVHVHLVIGDPITTGDEVSLIGIAAIDTTANMDVTVTAQWASAKAANTISLYQGYMEYKN